MNFNTSYHMLLGSEPHQITHVELILTLDIHLKLEQCSGHMWLGGHLLGSADPHRTKYPRKRFSSREDKTRHAPL